MKKGIKFTAIDSKRLAALLMSGIILTTAVGCKSNNVDKEPVDNDVQIEDVVDNPVQDVEQNVEKEELTENDLLVIAHFQKLYENVPNLIQISNNAANDLVKFEEVDVHYEEVVGFVFGNIKCEGLSVYDLSNLGKIEIIELLQAIDNELYPYISTTAQEAREWEHSWVPVAEELLEISGENQSPEVQAVKQQWLSGSRPAYRLYYNDLYAALGYASTKTK